MTNLNEVILNQRENILSNRYQLLTTQDVIKPFIDSGKFTIGSMEVSKRSKKVNNERVQSTHGAHIVRLRNEALKIGEDFIEIVISNSYDGSIPFKINLGIFRLVCSNGMIAGQSIFSQSIKHIGDDFQKRVITSLNESLDYTQDLTDKVNRMKKYELSNSEKYRLAMKIYSERLKDVINLKEINLDSSLQTERLEDNKRDLWTVLNVIQEKCLRGGIEYSFLKETLDDDKNVVDIQTKQRVTKGIFQPKKIVELNQMLFDEAIKLVA